MDKKTTLPARQRGMSLVEMMIAMTLSLLVIGAVSGVYLSTSRNYTQDEMLSRMQENARYALHVLAEDLSMAGYWGPIITDEDIEASARSCPETDSDGNLENHCTGFYEGSSLSIAADSDGKFCAPGTVGIASNWAISVQSSIEYVADVASGDVADDSFACIDAAGFLDGSDILVVKRVAGQELESTRDDSADAGALFLRTNGAEAMLFNYATDVDASEGPTSSDWRYRPRVYFVRNWFVDPGDGIPTLVRKTLVGNAMQTEAGGVAQGIEQFHVMFGVDNDGDGDTTPDFYTSNLAVADLDNVTSARIYVLARSVSNDPDYDNDKTYQLGDLSRTFNDNFYRRVFTTTVTLRNPRNRMSSSGG